MSIAEQCLQGKASAPRRQACHTRRRTARSGGQAGGGPRARVRACWCAPVGQGKPRAAGGRKGGWAVCDYVQVRVEFEALLEYPAGLVAARFHVRQLEARHRLVENGDLKSKPRPLTSRVCPPTHPVPVLAQRGFEHRAGARGADDVHPADPGHVPLHAGKPKL